jgi:hypothetical protein
MQYVGRNILGLELGVSGSHLFLSTMLECGLGCFNSILMCLILSGNQFLYQLREVYSRNLVLLVIVVLCACLLFFILCIKRKIVSLKEFCSLKFFSVYLKFSIINLPSLFFNSLVLYLLLNFISPNVNVPFRYLMTSYIISWLIGFITPGAPGGIGIRELVLCRILGSVYAEADILSVTILQRFTLIFGDIAAYFVFRFVVYKLLPQKPGVLLD